MKRITGTHVYRYAGCEHAVRLDLHGDRSERRPWTEVEELVLKRGRDLEDELVKDLGFAKVEFDPGDFAAGAAETEALLRQGVDGILQGVLVGEGRLGIPDLLRREEGASDYGDWHYVIGDVKSSRMARSDQVLQIMFYSRLLALAQGRTPDYAYLVLRDGREQRFSCVDYAPVLEDVEAALLELAADGRATRAFYRPGCRGCSWSQKCGGELEAADDLSLLNGMTSGVRTVLEGLGVESCAALADVVVADLAPRSELDVQLLMTLQQAAVARRAGRPSWLRKSAGEAREFAVVHLLRDAFADAVPFVGILRCRQDGREVSEAVLQARGQEVTALLDLIDELPDRLPLWHYGRALPQWIEDAGWRDARSAAATDRLLDLAPRLRGMATYPGPVFGLDDHIRQALGRDPDRAGCRDAVPLWLDSSEAETLLLTKGHADLDDLAALTELAVGAVRAS